MIKERFFCKKGVGIIFKIDNIDISTIDNDFIREYADYFTNRLAKEDIEFSDIVATDVLNTGEIMFVLPLEDFLCMYEADFRGYRLNVHDMVTFNEEVNKKVDEADKREFETIGTEHAREIVEVHHNDVNGSIDYYIAHLFIEDIPVKIEEDFNSFKKVVPEYSTTDGFVIN